MRHIFFTLLLISSVQIFAAKSSKNEIRGGSFFSMHTRSLDAFKNEVPGRPMTFGAMGCAKMQNYCMGGAGGAALVVGGASEYQLKMGYGGLYAEAVFWNLFMVHALAGGGGYRLEKTVLESDSIRISEKIANGGFVFIEPGWGIRIEPMDWLSLEANVGYFLSSVSQLSSLTLGMNVLFKL